MRRMPSCMSGRATPRRRAGRARPRQAAHAEQHLDREQRERRRQRREHPPLRRHQRLDGDRRPASSSPRWRARRTSTTQAQQAKAIASAEPFAVPRPTGRGSTRSRMSTRMCWPWRSSQGAASIVMQVEHGLGQFVAPGEAAHAGNQRNVAQQHVDADHQGHRPDQRTGGERAGLEQPAPGAVEPLQGAHFLVNSFCICGPCCGLGLITPAHADVVGLVAVGWPSLPHRS